MIWKKHNYTMLLIVEQIGFITTYAISAYHH